MSGARSANVRSDAILPLKQYHGNDIGYVSGLWPVAGCCNAGLARRHGVLARTAIGRAALTGARTRAN